MYPSLAAMSTREGITEYLATTFALADPAVSSALGDFLQDPDQGIFRGPYLRVRLPFLPVSDTWANPLGWSPSWFKPYRHQAKAFERLSTLHRSPQPTIVTTGTGSGKTEAFLLPLLDHARRAAEAGERGVKALILYPMNALVTDQARRIADFIHTEPELAGVRAGVYIGGEGNHTHMGPDYLIDVRSELRRNPPDILLTNYRMLDLLLLREADSFIWESSATSLQFVVLDEFHTYDGAQGTDVAMLLRRLGATLGVATPERPLGRICPVATSATLGSGSRAKELQQFAETVFATPFGADSIVGEERHSVDDLFSDLDFALDVPGVDEVLEAELPVASDPSSWQSLAEVFLGTRAADPVELGALLGRHILTRAVAQAIGESPLTVADAVREVAKAGALAWGQAAEKDPDRVVEALLRFMALLSVARTRTEDGALRPLVNVEVQMWVREVSRLLRELSSTPRFAWWSDGAPAGAAHWLPAVYCRACGSSGWQALRTELGDSFETTPTKIWQASVVDRGRSRTLIPASSDLAESHRLNTDTCALDKDGDQPVLVTEDDKAAERQRCPSCDSDDAIRFIGTAVATLVSVSLTQLFGLPSVPDGEKKTLVFTDSVQDAAHRAAFVEGRAFQFNFRAAVLRAVGEEPTTLPEVVDRLTQSPDEDLYVIAPPDFVNRLGYTGEYLSHRRRQRLALLSTRLGFQTHLEVGLRSRVGRTLELTGAMGVHVAYDEGAAVDLAKAVHQNLAVLHSGVVPDSAYRYWLAGIFDRLRSRGGIMHRWLDPYVKDDGRRWKIWGGSPVGMQKFPRGRPAPTFLTDRRSEAFDNVSSSTETWLNDWTRRCLGLPLDAARDLLPKAFDALSDSAGSPLRRTTSASGSAIYGLAPEAIVLSPGTDDEAKTGLLRLGCSECDHVQPVSAARAVQWQGSPCPRMRCGGRLHPVELDPGNFYRGLYRSGRLRRIVATEHTGLLDRDEREQVEATFKAGDSPVHPNVLACTPTLELGIDIGALSTVTLSSLPRTPANYLQRVGRAGRSNGNALILATIPTAPRDLYYFAEPLHLIAGDVVPPATYLEATELLQRQYLAYCLDRAAAGHLPVDLPGSVPATLGLLFNQPMEVGTWLRAFTDLITDHAEGLVGGFLELFGSHLSEPTAAAVRQYAANRVAEAVAKTALEWNEKRATCLARVVELNGAITKLDKLSHLDEAQAGERRAMLSERRAQLGIAESMFNQETFTGLSELSLLPNYNLLDDATTLDVSLWWTSDDDDAVQRADHSYQRGSRLALSEFAPGATFYARGQKVTVDAVETGPVANPAWADRRLCPSCGWGDEGSAIVAACPRCGETAIADVGAVHRVLPFREASAEHSRDEALIDDDAETRQRRRYASVTSVDIDPEHVRHAWRLKDQAFGAEYSTRAVVRSLNLGPLAEHGKSVSVAGERLVETAFRTCSHCGKWWPDDMEAADVRHRGWCPSRKGADPQWVNLVLGHELHTQAVRMLLPVSVFDYAAHLTAMKGSLLLGLRADFGGDPQHLDVLTASMPDPHGRPRRFLVLHDTVPGGTGYLDRIGEPERMRRILTLARDQLAACPCRSEGRGACHRCLLSVLGGGEIDQADRQLAVTLLDDVLGAWDVEEIDTVIDIDFDSVHLSELEKRFRAALMAWVAHQGSGAKAQEHVGPKGREIDLSLSDGTGATVRWRIRPLVDVTAAGVATQPDFLATRQDASGAPVAIYLDGKEFHASPAHNRTADDAWKRNALRSDGYRVWSLTWDDVDQFESTLASATPPKYPALVPPAVQNRMLSGGKVDDRIKLCWDNPALQLVSYLRAPDDLVWEDAAVRLSRAAIQVAKATPGGVGRTQMHSDLLAAVAGEPLPAVTDTTGVWAARFAGHGDLPLVLFAGKEDPTASWSLLSLLDDSDAAVGSQQHGEAWAAWLHWANVAQFLPLPVHGQDAVLRVASFWTTTSVEHFESQMMPLAAGAAASAKAALPAAWQELAGLDLDSTVEGVLADLAAGHAGLPEVGYELGEGRWMAELCWLDEHVVVVVDVDHERDDWLQRHGWKVVQATEERPNLAAEILEELAKA